MKNTTAAYEALRQYMVVDGDMAGNDFVRLPPEDMRSDDEAGRDAWETMMSDLLTDLQHLANEKGLDWVKIIDLADMNHEEESDQRTHPEWPARPGTDVGCDDRECETCYVQGVE